MFEEIQSARRLWTIHDLLYRDVGRGLFRTSQAAVHAIVVVCLLGLVLLRMAWLMETRRNEPRD